MQQHCIRDRSIQYSIRRGDGDETEQVHIITKMTDQSGGGGGSPVWLGVALVFVGMVGKDLFITDQGRDLLIVIILVIMVSTSDSVSTSADTGSSVSEALAGNTIVFEYCYS